MVNRRKTHRERLNHYVPYGMKLTPREREILKFVARGHTNAEIGRNLFISSDTVKTHLQRIGNKTEVGDRTSLGVWAFAQEIRDAMFVAETLPELRDAIYEVFQHWLSIDIYKRVIDLPTGLES